MAIEHGKAILGKKGFSLDKEFTGGQEKFIYAYCYYYIESFGKNKKYEKMRALFDMSRTLLNSAVLLMVLGQFKIFQDIMDCVTVRMIVEDVGKIVIFILLAILFYYRADKIAKYKARILMSVYDVCLDINKEVEKKTKENSNETNETTTIDI